jgi:hypothetical protein
MVRKGREAFRGVEALSHHERKGKHLDHNIAERSQIVTLEE